MQQVMTVASWVVWGTGLLYCIVFFFTRHQDGGVVMLSRRYAVLLAIGLIVTLFTDVSKLHLLWWAPLAYPLNLMLFAATTRMRMRGFAEKMAAQTKTTPAITDDEKVAKMRAEADRLRRDLDLLEDPETICSFGQTAFDGDGVEQDYVQAASWWKIAAEQGHARSQHNLALMYEKGQGFPRDFAEAAKWYRMAAKQGNAGSQNNLGALYESGTGVPQDMRIALDLYHQAAKGGDANAASNVHRLEALINNENG